MTVRLQASSSSSSRERIASRSEDYVDTKVSLVSVAISIREQGKIAARVHGGRARATEKALNHQTIDCGGMNKVHTSSYVTDECEPGRRASGGESKSE
jgi:hypothetical protein